MKEKETIIIVPGSSYVYSDFWPLRKMIPGICRIFNIVPDYSDKQKEWLSELKKSNRKLIFFKWDGKINPLSIKRAINSLMNLIEREERVKVVSFSLGTEIVLRAGQKVGGILGVVSTAGVYKPRRYNFSLIDISSKNDTFIKFSNKVLWPLSGQDKTAKKIILENFRHDEFLSGKKIKNGKYKGKNIFELVNLFLEEI